MFCSKVLRLLILICYLPTVLAQSKCRPMSCFRTSVRLSPSSIGARDPTYACRSEGVTFICQVINGVALQWASEPDIPCDNPMSYTPGDDAGDKSSGFLSIPPNFYCTKSSTLKLQLSPYSHSTSICEQCNNSMW